MNNLYAIGFHNGEICLMHYRTPGSKNGVRRYQNEDGSLTPEGYAHYGIDPNKNYSGKKLEKIHNKISKDTDKSLKENNALWKEAQKEKDIEKKKEIIKQHQVNQETIMKGLAVFNAFRKTKDKNYASFANRFESDSKKEWAEEDKYKKRNK